MEEWKEARWIENRIVNYGYYVGSWGGEIPHNKVEMKSHHRSTAYKGEE
jgi:hypothetical protein